MKLGKYAAALHVTWQNRLAYRADQFGRALFLVVVMYVFVALWRTTYRATGQGEWAGLSLSAMLWYLAFTETLWTAFPRFDNRIGGEVRSGDIAYSLNKPYNYLGFQYALFMGEFSFTFLVCLAVTGAVCLATVGGFPYRITLLPMHLITLWLAGTVTFLQSACVGLLAFWIEDTYGLSLLVSRAQALLGGLLFPLDLFPAWLRRIAALTPFQASIGEPARLLAGSPSVRLGHVLGLQLAWCAVLGVLAVWIYGRGVRRVHVNGG